MEMEKSKVLIQFPLIFRRSGDVLFFLYARRLRGYTATLLILIAENSNQNNEKFSWKLSHPNHVSIAWKHEIFLFFANFSTRIIKKTF